MPRGIAGLHNVHRKIKNNSGNDSPPTSRPNHRLTSVKLATPGDITKSLSNEEKEVFRLLKAKEDALVIKNYYEKNRPLINLRCCRWDGHTILTMSLRQQANEVVEYLLEKECNGLENIGDLNVAVLHAVKSGNTKITEMILQKISDLGGDEQRPCEDAQHFDAHTTPIVLAALRNDFPMVRMLLDRGHEVEIPHRAECKCESCAYIKREGEPLRFVHRRVDAYRALASPAHLVQACDDVFREIIDLTNELDKCQASEPNYRKEYEDLAKTLKQFLCDLFSQAATSEEMEILLSKRDGVPPDWESSLPRLQLALHNNQKTACSQLNVQDVVRKAWLGKGWSDWDVATTRTRLFRIILHTFLCPFMAVMYAVAPCATFVHSVMYPIARYMSHMFSYLCFVLIVFFESRTDRLRLHRGVTMNWLKWYMVLYCVGMLVQESHKIWRNGLKRHFRFWWHWLDALFLTTFIFTFYAWAWANINVAVVGLVDMPRRKWHNLEPTLVAQAAFSVAQILTCWRFMYYLLPFRTMGTLIISLGYCLKDTLGYIAVFLLLWLSFAIGMNYIYEPYQEEVWLFPNGTKVHQNAAFTSFVSALRALYWTMYGYNDPVSADIVLGNEGNFDLKYGDYQHEVTQFVGLMLYGLYHIIAIIILLNLMIAIMSNTAGSILLTDHSNGGKHVEELVLRPHRDRRTLRAILELQQPRNINHASHVLVTCLRPSLISVDPSLATLYPSMTYKGEVRWMAKEFQPQDGPDLRVYLWSMDVSGKVLLDKHVFRLTQDDPCPRISSVVLQRIEDYIVKNIEDLALTPVCEFMFDYRNRK